MKRILIYNWAEFDDVRGRGGGVSVFLQTLIRQLSANRVEVFFLSAGCHYSFFRSQLEVQEYQSSYSNMGVRSFRVWNSPVKAPSKDAFFSLDRCLNSSSIDDAFSSFIDRYGPFNEVQLHGFEGISTSVIKTVKNHSIAPRLVLWAHNYHLVCPQLNLFRVADLRPCADFQSGSLCVNCIGPARNMREKIVIQSVVSSFEVGLLSQLKFSKNVLSLIQNVFLKSRKVFRIISNLLRRVSRQFLAPESRPKVVETSSDSVYLNWREQNCMTVNRYVDCVYAVSTQAKQKLVKFGISEEKVRVVPISVDITESDKQFSDEFTQSSSDNLIIGFLGNDLPEKGLSFLIDALCGLNVESRTLVELHIYAKLSKETELRLNSLGCDFLHIKSNGYQRSQLPSIAKKLDLIVVPSLWWETYNLVALEMAKLGIPVIHSDHLGISPYLDPSLRFNAGDVRSLTVLLERTIKKYELNGRLAPANLKLPSVERMMNMLSEVVSEG